MKMRFEPALLKWARNRAQLEPSALASRIFGAEGSAAHIEDWEKTGKLTYRQAETLAEVTQIPFGYLFLKTPPVEKLPIKDFRTVEGAGVSNPSANLLDTIYQCQMRQEWYREYLLSRGAEPLDFAATLDKETPVKAAARIREKFGIGPDVSKDASTAGENLTLHIEATTTFKVSALVAARRAKDAGFRSESNFKAFYDSELARCKAAKKAKGGSFYNSLNARASNNFCRALISRTLEGKTTYRDAFSLLNVSSSEAIHNFAREKLGLKKFKSPFCHSSIRSIPVH